MPGPTDLFALADDVLTVVLASLDEIPLHDVSLAGAPTRAFVSPGEPVWDCCEMVTTHVQSIGALPLSGSQLKPHVRGQIPMMTVVATATRCVPDGTVVGMSFQPPSAAELETVARQIHADGWAIHNGILRSLAAGLLHDRCKQIEWDGLRSATPSGGCAGWTFSMRMRIDGYPIEAAS